MADTFSPLFDVKAQILTPLKAELQAEFPGIGVGSTQSNEPTTFPYCSVVQRDGYYVRNKLDSGDVPRLARLMFQVNVYSNATSGKEAQANKIMSFVDQRLYQYNFVLTTSPVTIEPDTASYCWIAARYEVEADKDGVLYRPSR